MRRLASFAVCCLLLIFLPPAASRACTSFCLETPDGPAFATNLDLMTGDGHVFVNRRGISKRAYGTGTTGEVARWMSNYGSVTFNLVGRELPWAGMNEAGLVMSSMQLLASRCPAPDERPPVGESQLVQYVLDTCGTIDEVIDAVSRVRMEQHECTSHYLVADETGACASIEFLDGRFVYHAGETLPVKAMANAPYAAGVAFIDRGVVPVDNPGASVERVAAAAARAASFRPEHGSAIDYAFDVLTKTVVAPKRWWSGWFDEPYTRWNVVFDVPRRDVYYRSVDSPDVKHVALGSFDFSCEAPLLMLDVNAELEGNVDGSFGGYDHDVNLKTFRTFCDKWGIDVSKEDSVALIEMFEGFECVHVTP